MSDVSARVEALTETVKAGAHFYMGHKMREYPHPNAPEITMAEHAASEAGCPACEAEKALTELRSLALQAAQAQGCDYGCGPTDPEVYVNPGVGIVPMCPVHGWMCEILDAAEQRVGEMEAALRSVRKHSYDGAPLDRIYRIIDRALAPATPEQGENLAARVQKD